MELQHHIQRNEEQGANRAMLEILLIRNRMETVLSMEVMPMTIQCRALPTADTLSLSLSAGLCLGGTQILFSWFHCSRELGQTLLATIHCT